MNEKDIIADVFKEEISRGTVKTEHVQLHKEVLANRLTTFENNRKFLKRILDAARNLAKLARKAKTSGKYYYLPYLTLSVKKVNINNSRHKF